MNRLTAIRNSFVLAALITFTATSVAAPPSSVDQYDDERRACTVRPVNATTGASSAFCTTP